MSEELAPETPETAEAEPIKQRKNGLYPGVSDELAENMKSGWADTELHGLEPIAQAVAHRRPPRRALRALPRRAAGHSRGQPEDPLQRHRVRLPRLHRVRVPHR